MHALLIIDMQNDFMPWGALPVQKADTLISYINLLMKGFSHVIASQDWHPQGHVSFASTHKKPLYSTLTIAGKPQILWPDHCVMETPGAAFVKGLDIGSIHKVVRKGCDLHVDSYSAFFDNAKKHDSGLNEYCKANDITALTVVGVALEYCVKFSVLDALDLGYAVYVDLKGCHGVETNQGDCANAIAEMKARGAQILE